MVDFLGADPPKPSDSPPDWLDEGPELSDAQEPTPRKNGKAKVVDLDGARRAQTDAMLDAQAQADASRIVWGRDLETDSDPMPWVSYGLKIGPGRPTIICGEGGSRKSMFAQYLAICVSLGLRVFDRFDCDYGPTLFLDFEQGLRLSKRRVRRFANGMQFRLGDYHDKIAYLQHPFDFDDIAIVPRLVRLVSGFKLVVVDSVFRSASRLRQNDAEASLPMQIMTLASEQTGVSFLGVDHASTKRDPEAKRKSMQSGNHHKLDGSGTVYMLTAEKGKPTLVTCEREQQEGEETPDFAFTIDDIPSDFEEPPFSAAGEDIECTQHRAWRKWGLLMREVETKATVDEPRPKAKPKDEALPQIAERVLQEILSKPGISTKELLATMGIAEARFHAARDQLTRTGRIVNRTGKATRTEWVAQTGLREVTS